MVGRRHVTSHQHGSVKPLLDMEQLYFTMYPEWHTVNHIRDELCSKSYTSDPMCRVPLR